VTNNLVVYGEENGDGPSKDQMIKEGNWMLEKKMVATQRHMNQAFYTLSRLVEAEENLHQLLEGGSPGRILFADLVADIPYYIKIECKDGAVSPI
jgi:hypothetical protein